MSDNTKTYTDIKKNGWQVRIFPINLQPYAILMRLDRPIGWWLLLLPGWWSIALASGGLQNMNANTLLLMTLFWIGAIIMRGAGCVINDIWDRNLDKAVERTRDRPIASGAVRLKSALIFLAFLLAIGASILFSLHTTAILIGLFSLPLIIAYPLMKRITYWPQAFLGITFNFGALIGWAAVSGTLGWPAILLYIGGIFWTIGYDTIYAHQDKEDDLSVGIKSTALKFGVHSKKWLALFYTLAFLCMASAIIMVKPDLIVLLTLILPLIHFIWQIYSWDMDNQDNSLQKFKSNKNFGLALLLCCLA